MEKVYAPNKFECSNHIDLNEYFSNFNKKWTVEEWHSLSNNMAIENACFHQLGIVDKNLQKSISSDMCLDELENHIEEDEQKMTDNAAANTKKFKTFAALSKFNAKFPKRELVHTNKEVVKGGVVTLQAEKHFVAKIRIYHPFEFGATKRYSKAFFTQKLRFSHEVVLLQSNTLAEFRDKILCHNDRGMCVEYDHLTEETLSANPKVI